jgi:hypothetical protein
MEHDLGNGRRLIAAALAIVFLAASASAAPVAPASAIGICSCTSVVGWFKGYSSYPLCLEDRPSCENWCDSHSRAPKLRGADDGKRFQCVADPGAILLILDRLNHGVDVGQRYFNIPDLHRVRLTPIDFSPAHPDDIRFPTGPSRDDFGWVLAVAVAAPAALIAWEAATGAALAWWAGATRLAPAAVALYAAGTPPEGPPDRICAADSTGQIRCGKPISPSAGASGGTPGR